MAACNCADNFGATLAVTEIHPTPPWALNPCAVASSPDICKKLGPHVMRCAHTLAKSPVASLTPIILGNLAVSYTHLTLPTKA